MRGDTLHLTAPGRLQIPKAIRKHISKQLRKNISMTIQPKPTDYDKTEKLKLQP
ncbi:hypothetical protein FUAX_53720 (plasmid) [Fulvitalea axinellae]|uniref:SpoVT-AbrB domain-containing protein n=1 Tax=Fulvitalea axinellae TaxID=1182444 RepID=A0AAU9DP04_9BACT|nr:hypothetical protein FUAX_53720 [Fulvitalea axinellae]